MLPSFKFVIRYLYTHKPIGVSVRDEGCVQTYLSFFICICTILNKPTVASDAGTTRAPVTTDAATGMNAPNVAVGVAASLSDEVRMVWIQ